MYNSDIPTRAELPTSKQLLRSTLIAIATAIVILVTIVLPAEYNIDPTRICRLLGLAQMPCLAKAPNSSTERAVLWPAFLSARPTRKRLRARTRRR